MQRIIVFILFIMSLTTSYSQTNIWEGTSCNKKVTLTPCLTNGKNNIAVIVCPGGSYFWHDTETEGNEVAKWLQNNGISAFTLDYRTAYVPAFITHFRLLFRGNRYPDPQEDLLQAIKHIKENAENYGIDTTKIGVMGFSAGGHLAMSSAELFQKSDRPAFIAPIYPVVTMTKDCVHKRSRRGLLGDSRVRNKRLKDLLSLEEHVSPDCPPVFLVNCEDDPIVDYRNSILLDSALTANKVSHKYLLYKTGGHGFGASESKGTPECRQWKTEFLEWIKKLFEK